MGEITNFPFGLSSWGTPVVGFRVGVPASGLATGSPGQVLFVDAVNGSDGQDGLSPETALRSITRAIVVLDKLPGLSKGGGDTVFIMPGSYSGNLVVTRDYVTFVGCQFAGYAKPDIEAAAGVTLTVNAQGFRAMRCRFAGTADVVVQSGNGFEYSECVFDGDGNGPTTALLRLVPATLRGSSTHFTASEGVIQDNLFRGSGGFGIVFDSAANPIGVGSTDNRIVGNRFYANFAADIAAAKTGAPAAYSATTGSIDSNLFMEHNKAIYIDLTTNTDGPLASNSGLISRNDFCTSLIDSSNILIAGTHWCFVSNEDENGIINGVALGGEGPAAPPLGVAATYGAGARASVSNTGATTIAGRLYLTPGSSITGAPTTGGNDVNNPAALAAAQAVLNAYNSARARSGALPLPGNITGITLAPGLYDNASSVLISGGNVTLDAQGDANAVFILRTGSTLTLITTAGVTLINGAQAKNVFWIVGSSATLGAGSTLKGNVLAAVSITLNTAALVTGRLFAGADGTLSGALVLDTNVITAP